MQTTFKMRTNPKQIVKCLCFISKMHISRTRHMRSITGNTGCWWWPVSESDSSEDSIEVHHVCLAKFAEFSQFWWSPLRNTLEIYCKFQALDSKKSILLVKLVVTVLRNVCNLTEMDTSMASMDRCSSRFKAIKSRGQTVAKRCLVQHGRWGTRFNGNLGALRHANHCRSGDN